MLALEEFIALVEHHHPQLPYPHQFPLHHLQHASDGPHYHVSALLQVFLTVVLEGNPADRHQQPNLLQPLPRHPFLLVLRLHVREAVHDFLQVLVDLQGELAGGEDDEVAAGGGERWRAQDVGEDDADVAESFTCAGLGLGDDGAAARGVGVNGVVLDGSGTREAQGLVAAGEVAVEARLLEPQGLVHLDVLVHINFSYKQSSQSNSQQPSRENRRVLVAGRKILNKEINNNQQLIIHNGADPEIREEGGVQVPAAGGRDRVPQGLHHAAAQGHQRAQHPRPHPAALAQGPRLRRAGLQLAVLLLLHQQRGQEVPLRVPGTHRGGRPPHLEEGREAPVRAHHRGQGEESQEGARGPARGRAQGRQRRPPRRRRAQGAQGGARPGEAGRDCHGVIACTIYEAYIIHLNGKRMQKLFTIENMETYFTNYIPCNEHRKEPVTNFCTEGPCLKFLCPECVEIHSTVHSNHSIESIRTCIKKTSKRLRETIQQLEAETSRNSFLRPDNTEEYTKQLIRELEEVKEGLIQEIKAYFREKEFDIRKETSRYSEIQKKLEGLKKDLLQATSELRMLEKNLFNPQETLKAIKKANKLSYGGMVAHFHERIDEVEREMAFDLRLEMNNEKREALKASLNELIGIKNKTSNKFRPKLPLEKAVKDKAGKAQNIVAVSNVVPLSADRLLQQNSFRIDSKNFFESGPFLHFFEVSNSSLHVVRLEGVRNNEEVRWEVVPLEIGFKIPSFHRTIATEKGEIFVIGGTSPETLKRSRDIYQFSRAGSTLTRVAELLVARSSHSVLCHQGVIYISGGMTNNDETLRKCEIFLPRSGEVRAMASCKYETTNACLCAIGADNLLKFGGVHASGENNNTLEVYSIRGNLWTEVDPTIEHQGEFGLLSCSGWAPLNESQVFVFGGYNEEIESENSRMSFVIERKFKYPVYYTEEYLPASTIESYKVSQTGQVSKDALLDYISARIYLGELKRQLERSKKGTPPDYVTIDVKLIASVNEVIRTINRVLLQDYGVVITMRNAINKLIFKVRDKNEYLYGNESIVNFQFIRESLNERAPIDLEILEVSIYDKEQFQRYIFHRSSEDLARGQFTGFPWEDFLAKHPSGGDGGGGGGEEVQFLLWHLPEEQFQHPESTVEIEKLYSTDELVRTNEKIKLKLEERKRLQVKKIPRFLWKERIGDFLEKRRGELKNRYVEIEGSVIYSGECFFAFEMELLAVSGVFSLLKGAPCEDKIIRKKFLRFQSKEMFAEVGAESRLPSLVTRYLAFMGKKRRNEVEIVPFMLNVGVQFVIGSRVLASMESRCVLADNCQQLGERLSWGQLARMPMETSIVFRLSIFAKEGDGFTFGVGALKLFDENGFMAQGRQEVQLYALERMELFRIGCIDKRIDEGLEPTGPPCSIAVQLPRFRNSVIWTLSDLACAKLLGYLPQMSGREKEKEKEENNLERLNELLRFDSLAIHGYDEKDKGLLRRCKKYYRHQSDKLVNYLYAVDWTDPAQLADVYATLAEWQPLKPIEALFLLSPALADERVRYYAVRRMESFLDYEWVLYANQITQALVSFETDTNPLIELVLEKCVHEPFSIGQEFFWQFKNRVDELFTAYRFNQYLEALLMLTSFRRELAQQVRINNYLVEMNEALIKETESLSNFRDKNKKFQSSLAAVEGKFNELCPGGFNFPIRPQFVFKGFKREECKMYDSKKLPFALSCLPSESYKGEPYRVMFKYGDDLKQDSLVLQMFRVFDKLWRENGLDFKMNIYRTLSTGTEIGFIEIVDAENNSKIHKDYAKGLVDAFDERTTAVFLEDKNRDKRELAMAKENYLRSSAGYLVATYVMGIGDRHSGNVMVQKNGKFFHIDFGHILGNFKMKFGVKRERTPVLFTSEFLYVMGGPDSKEFVRFQEYCSKAFNILRKNAYLIVNLLAMMVSAEIPQLKSLQDIEYVTEKLALELSDAQAAERLVMIIKETLLSEKSRNIDNAFHEANREG